MAGGCGGLSTKGGCLDARILPAYRDGLMEQSTTGHLLSAKNPRQRQVFAGDVLQKMPC
jgi:hypothetical protein